MVSIAMVTPWKVRCGIYTYSEKLSRALADLGLEVYIVRLPRFGKKAPELLEKLVEKIPIDRIELIHVQHEYGLYQDLESSFYRPLAFLRKPIVTTMHSVGNFNIDPVIANLSDRVIVHNDYCKRRFNRPCGIIPHGCDVRETPPLDAAKRTLGIPPQVPIVGYCGFITPYKGLETLIDAMVKVKAGLVVGGGWHTETQNEYITGLQVQGRKLKNRVQWLGYIEEEKMDETYGAFDIVVYPSRFSTESGALLTAIGYSKPIIASSLPPFIEKEKEGALWTFSTVRSLTMKIRRLLKSKGDREKLIEGARAYAEKNSWENVARKHLELYGEVVK